MIFSLLNIYNYYRMSSVPQVLHSATWDYFTSHLPGRFSRSPQVVKEAIMTDINDLVQEFQRTSSDVGLSFFAMRCLLKILQGCLSVCFIIISALATLSLELIKIYYRSWQNPRILILPPSRAFSTESEPYTTIEPEPNITTEPELILRYSWKGVERCLISHFLNPTIWLTCLCSYLES